MSPANDFVVPIGEKGEATLEAWFLMNSHASHSGIISIETIDAGCCEFRMMVSPNFKPFGMLVITKIRVLTTSHLN